MADGSSNLSASTTLRTPTSSRSSYKLLMKASINEMVLEGFCHRAENAYDNNNYDKKYDSSHIVERSCKSVERWLEEKSSALDWYFNEISMGMEHFELEIDNDQQQVGLFFVENKQHDYIQNVRYGILKMAIGRCTEHNENTSLGSEVCTWSLSIFKKIQKLFLRHHKIRLWCCNMSMASNCSTVCWGKGVKTMNRVNRSLHIVSIKASRKGCCDKPSHDDTVLNILLLPFGSPFYVFKPTIDLASQMNYTHSKCAIRRSIHTIHIQTIFL
ncbi:hypothetical protein LXL04_028869 [Taraxacum kok-saghyz]